MIPTVRRHQCGATAHLPHAVRTVIARHGEGTQVLPEVAQRIRCELEWHPLRESHHATVRHLPMSTRRAIWATWRDDDTDAYRIHEWETCPGTTDYGCGLIYGHQRGHSPVLEPHDIEPADVEPASVLYDAERLCRRVLVLPADPTPARLAALRTETAELGALLRFLANRTNAARMGENLMREAADDIRSVHRASRATLTPAEVSIHARAWGLTVARLIPLYRDQLAGLAPAAPLCLPTSPRKDAP